MAVENSKNAFSGETIGVVGAGMMGAGITYCAAKKGFKVLLKDESIELASKGKNVCEKILKRESGKLNLSQSECLDIMNHIQVVDNFDSFSHCNLVIEAVYENRGLKNQVIQQLNSHLPKYCLLASNTSTLPISTLAEKFCNPSQYLGLHFFSPVHKMKLVEIIKGNETSQETIELAKNFVLNLDKVPIVVGDGRGFFTTRVFQSYVYEGFYAIVDGVDPKLIEEAAVEAGMPVGPLALADEVSLDLLYNINAQLENDTGVSVDTQSVKLLKQMVDVFKRLGRKSKKGFYNYSSQGKELWPELSEHFSKSSPESSRQFSKESIKNRLLYIQCLESVKAKAEGVVLKNEDGDTGSILGLGFPKEKGGVFSFIKSIGVEIFAQECQELAVECGPRFQPPKEMVNYF